MSVTAFERALKEIVPGAKVNYRGRTMIIEAGNFSIRVLPGDIKRSWSPDWLGREYGRRLLDAIEAEG